MIHFRLKYVGNGRYQATCDEVPGHYANAYTCQEALEELRDNVIEIVYENDRGCKNPWSCYSDLQCANGHKVPKVPLYDSSDCPECEKLNGPKQEDSSTK